MENAIQELAVIRFAEGWRVMGAGASETLHQFRVDAEEAALRVAAEAGRRGVQMVVLIECEYGRLRPLPGSQPADQPAVLAGEIAEDRMGHALQDIEKAIAAA